MPIEFRCTQCGSLLRTPDGSAGRTAQCPQCGARMPIPGAGAEQPSPAERLVIQEPAASEQSAPFAAEDEQAADTMNPYAAPGAYGSGADFALPAGRAASRVSGPAIALIVVGILSLCEQILGLMGNIFQVAVLPQMGPGGAGGQDLPPGFELFVGALGLVSGIVGLILTAVMLIGAMKMKRLEHYGWSMASAIIAIIPCFAGCCCLLRIPFGIWALVVLSDPGVKAAFRA